MGLIGTESRLLRLSAALGGIIVSALLAAPLAAAAPGDLGAQRRISVTGPDGDTTFRAQTPAVAYNPNANQYLVVWQGDTATANEREIQARLIGPGGEPIGAQFRISTMGPDNNPNFDAASPAVAYNATANEYMVVWSGDDAVDDETEIFAQRLTATGAEVGTDDQQISTMGPAANPAFDARSPAVVYNPTAGEYLVSWDGDDGGALADDEFEIYAQRLSATGAEVGPDDQRISSMGPDNNGTFGAQAAAVAFDPTTDAYLVAWSGDDNTAPLVNDEFEIYVQRLTASTGAEVGTDDQRISSMGPDGDSNFGALTPDIAYDQAADEYLVSWYGDDGGSLADDEYEIYAQRLSAAGGEVGTDDQRISVMGPDNNANFKAFFPAAAFNATANEFLIAWQGDDNTAPLVDNDNEIFGRTLAAADVPSPPTPPDASLDGAAMDLAKKQTIKGKDVKVKVATGCAEECTSSVTGSVLLKASGKRSAKSKSYALKAATVATAAGNQATVTLKLNGSKPKRRKATEKILAAIRRGGKVRATVSAQFIDSAGNTASSAGTTKLKAKRAHGG